MSPRAMAALVWWSSLLGAAPLGAQKPAPPLPKPPGAERYLTKGAPVRIRSEKLAVFNNENRALFTGKVVAKQGDLTIEADELITRYKPGGGLAGLEATGNVRVRKGDKRGTGRKLTYDHDLRVLELTGDPKLWEKDSFLEGDKLVFHLDEDRVDVERARGRLKMEDKP